MRATTSASASSVKSTLSFPPALCNELAYSKWCDEFLMYLTIMAKNMNWKRGNRLDTQECEDAAMHIFTEFDQEYRAGKYDKSISKPQTFKYKRLRDHITDLIREKDKIMRAKAGYAEEVNMADEMFATIPADEISRSKEAYQRKLYSIIRDELSESDRMILDLKIQGLKNQEISEILGCSYGSCTKRIHDFRERLKAKLYLHPEFRGLLARV